MAAVAIAAKAAPPTAARAWRRPSGNEVEDAATLVVSTDEAVGSCSAEVLKRCADPEHNRTHDVSLMNLIFQYLPPGNKSLHRRILKMAYLTVI